MCIWEFVQRLYWIVEDGLERFVIFGACWVGGGVVGSGFGDCGVVWSEAYADGLGHRGCCDVMWSGVCRRLRWGREECWLCHSESRDVGGVAGGHWENPLLNFDGCNISSRISRVARAGFYFKD